jgi:hypothetical protein
MAKSGIRPACRPQDPLGFGRDLRAARDQRTYDQNTKISRCDTTKQSYRSWDLKKPSRSRAGRRAIGAGIEGLADFN